MELSAIFRKELYDNYRIYFNYPLNAWTREKQIGFTNKVIYNDIEQEVEISEDAKKLSTYQLGIITKLITGENILLKGKSYLEATENPIECEYDQACVCGCTTCLYLYKLYHVETNIAFYVGSTCIHKAGHDNFVKDIKLKNGRCKNCNLPLKIKGKNKNYNKMYKSCCKNCYDDKNVKVILNIKYSEKDKFKKYNIQWNATEKHWFWVGVQSEMPEELKEDNRIISVEKIKIKSPEYISDDFRSDSDSDSEETLAGSRRF